MQQPLQQVVQFYFWKAPLLLESRRETPCHMRPARSVVTEEIGVSKIALPCDHQLAMRILGHVSCDVASISFGWDDFAVAVEMWEEYVNSLHEDMLLFIPYWVSHQNIFFVDPSELKISS